MSDTLSIGKTHVVYHGTSIIFRPDIEAKGLIPPPGHGKGVRVTLRRRRAERHARAYCAKFMAERAQPPRGLVVRALVHESRLLDAGDGGAILRVPAGIGPHELADRDGRFRFAAPFFAELYDPDVAAEALEDFEELTGQTLNMAFPRRRARRS